MHFRQWKRREFITLLGGAAAWPLAARAQQADRMRRIGVLMALSDGAEGRSRFVAFREALKELGWSEGRNILFDLRWGSGDPDTIRLHATELAAQAPDVILANSAPAALAMREATRTVPVVFLQVADPVGAGIVPSLARPGGNLTGFTSFEPQMAGKWLELLKEIAPRVTRVALVQNPAHPTWGDFNRQIGSIASSFGVRVTPAGVRDLRELDHAIQEFAREPDGGMIVLPDAFTSTHAAPLIALAERFRLPAVYPIRMFAVGGGLMAYGNDPLYAFRRAASYVDRVLKGAKPAELPVEAADKFDLVVNLKTAKALGLDVPLPLLMRINEAIE